MKLRVDGVETIEVTDPGKVCGHRKHLDQNLLRKLKGLAFTAVELKQMFGYSKFTALCDTQLDELVEAVNENKAEPYAEKSTLWRVK